MNAMFGKIAQFLKGLNANSNPSEIAHAVAAGVLLGFVPKNNLLWYFLFFLLCFFRINKGAYFVTIALVSLFMPFADPLFDEIGYKFLMIPSLAPKFSAWLEIPFVAFTKFNNTIVAGSLLCGFALYIPIFILARLFVRLWRKKLSPAFSNSRLVQRLKAVGWIQKILSLFNFENPLE